MEAKSSGAPGDPLHAELAVVRLLREARLEDDHRGHDVRALDVRDVEALDALRLDLEVEEVPQRAQDLLRLLARVLPLQLEGQPRVAHDELEQAQLLPALGHVDADEGPAPGGEPRLQEVAVRDLLRHHDLAGHVAPPGVELLQGRGERPPRAR